MADVSITIRKNDATGAETLIMVSGKVDDSALAPFTNQLSTLLSATANTASALPASSTTASASAPTA